VPLLVPCLGCAACIFLAILGSVLYFHRFWHDSMELEQGNFAIAQNQPLILSHAEQHSSIVANRLLN
jgi:hypothetical protein